LAGVKAATDWPIELGFWLAAGVVFPVATPATGEAASGNDLGAVLPPAFPPELPPDGVAALPGFEPTPPPALALPGEFPAGFVEGLPGFESFFAAELPELPGELPDGLPGEFPDEFPDADEDGLPPPLSPFESGAAAAIPPPDSNSPVAAHAAAVTRRYRWTTLELSLD
jgi:hypothetical protein